MQLFHTIKKFFFASEIFLMKMEIIRNYGKFHLSLQVVRFQDRSAS